MVRSIRFDFRRPNPRKHTHRDATQKHNNQPPYLTSAAFKAACSRRSSLWLASCCARPCSSSAFFTALATCLFQFFYFGGWILQTLGMTVCKKKKLKGSWLDLISIQANIRRFRRRRPSEGHDPLSHLLLHLPLEPLLQRFPLRRRLRLERLLCMWGRVMRHICLLTDW